jgi:hypothetical protein
MTLFQMPYYPSVFLAIGAHAHSDRMLQLISALALRQTVTVLDCGNRYHMNAVAKLIRPYTFRPGQCDAQHPPFPCFYLLPGLANGPGNFQKSAP